MNNIVLIGNLCRDPELKYLQSGTAVANYALAVNNPFKKEEGEKMGVDFINIVTFGKPAENLAKYMAKGCKLAVQGRLQVRTWKDKENKTRYTSEVVTNQVTFLTFPDKGQGQSTQQSNDYAQLDDDEDVPF